MLSSSQGSATSAPAHAVFHVEELGAGADRAVVVQEDHELVVGEGFGKLKRLLKTLLMDGEFQPTDGVPGSRMVKDGLGRGTLTEKEGAGRGAKRLNDDEGDGPDCQALLLPQLDELLPPPPDTAADPQLEFTATDTSRAP